MATSEAVLKERLSGLLVQFTLRVLQEKPVDLVGFAADYFTSLRRASATTPTVNTSMSLDEKAMEEIDDVVDLEEPIKVAPMRLRGRRNSVSSEVVKDPSLLSIKTVPKTPEQQIRLALGISRAKTSVFFLRKISDKQLQLIMQAMSELTVKAGTELIKQGDDGDFFYVIECGNFEVFKSIDGNPEAKVHEYNDEGCFGEIALLHNDLRAATVRASSMGVLWAIDRESFKGIMCGAEQKTKALQEEFLRKVNQLKDLNPDELRKVADALIPQIYVPGEIIIKEGDQADGMYFIEDGQVTVSIAGPAQDESIFLKTLNPGSYFGEAALLDKSKRNATVTAESSCMISKLKVDAFERLLGPCKEIMARDIEFYKQERIRLGFS